MDPEEVQFVYVVFEDGEALELFVKGFVLQAGVMLTAFVLRVLRQIGHQNHEL